VGRVDKVPKPFGTLNVGQNRKMHVVEDWAEILGCKK